MNAMSKDPVVVQSTGWMSQLVFSRHWNSKEVDSNATEGMGLLQRQSKWAKSSTFLLSCPYIGFQQKAWARLEVSLPTSKIQIRSGSFHFILREKKSLTDVPHVEALVNSIWSQVDNQEQPSQSIRILLEPQDCRCAVCWDLWRTLSRLRVYGRNSSCP